MRGPVNVKCISILLQTHLTPCLIQGTHKRMVRF